MLERDCAAAGAFRSPRDASALWSRGRQMLGVQSLCGFGRQSGAAKALQWKCREGQRRDGLCDAGTSVRVGFKDHWPRKCVASARSSGSARHEEVQQKRVAEGSVNGDPTKAPASSKEDSISGRVVFGLLRYYLSLNGMLLQHWASNYEVILYTTSGFDRVALLTGIYFNFL